MCVDSARALWGSFCFRFVAIIVGLLPLKDYMHLDTYSLGTQLKVLSKFSTLARLSFLSLKTDSLLSTVFVFVLFFCLFVFCLFQFSSVNFSFHYFRQLLHPLISSRESYGTLWLSRCSFCEYGEISAFWYWWSREEILVILFSLCFVGGVVFVVVLFF